MWLIFSKLLCIVNSSQKLIKSSKTNHVTQLLELTPISRSVDEIVIIQNETFVTIPLDT